MGFSIYPPILDFTSNDEIIIEYFMRYPHSTNNIRLNPDSEDLSCDRIHDYIKKCIVPKSHFENLTNGYYYTYYLNPLGEFTIFYELFPLQVFLSKDNNITLRIRNEYNKNKLKIGIGGTLVFITDYYNERKLLNNNIEEYTKFKSIIVDPENNEYEVDCKLWNPIDENIRILCNLNQELNNNNQKIIFKNIISFDYNEYNITIIQEDPIEVEYLNYQIPFLYSDYQTINILDEEEFYIFQFKFEKYFDNILYIYGQSNNNYAVLDNCEKIEYILECNISRNKLEEILTINNEKFKVGAIDDKRGIIELDYIFEININYINIKREKLFIQITKLITSTSGIGVPFGYETNITDVPNFVSKIGEHSDYYFKKIHGKPLTIFMTYDHEVDTYISYFHYSRTFIDDIHYKYIFIVETREIEDDISIKGNGTDIKLIYPDVLDITSEGSLFIRYIMPFPSFAKNIRLVPDSSDLECENLNLMKICKVSLDHFLDKKNGYFYIYHSDYQNEIVEYYDLSPIKVKFPYEEDIIEIYIEEEDNNFEQTIGLNGLLYFVSNYTDNDNRFNSDDIEEKTVFETVINDENKNNYNATCNLWKLTNEKLRIFCKLNNSLSQNSNKIRFNTARFYYDNQKVKIVSNIKYISVKQINEIIPFLYSEKQSITIEENKDSYNLMFKILEYDNEVLFLFSESIYIVLTRCMIESKNLICKMEKAEFEEYLPYSNLKFKLKYYNHETQTNSFPNVYDIDINYNILIKEDIYVGITKLLDNTIDIYNYITYETNVTNINDIFSGEFIYNISETIQPKCHLKKTKDKPLLILCSTISQGTFYIGDIKHETELYEINIKYNFFIQPVINYEEVTINSPGSSNMFITPKLLDFTLNDEINIEFFMLYPENSKNIRLNLYSDNLICENKNNNIKKCLVPKSHFENKLTGDYYMYHLNHLNKYSIYYELSPIRVILSNENNIVLRIKKEFNPNMIKIGDKEKIFILVTNYNDNERNIFKNIDLEKSIKFNSTLTDRYNMEFQVNCRLWNPKDDNIRIICNIYESYFYSYQDIKFKEISFNYKEYNITIIQEELLNFEVLYGNNIPILYSEKQIIIIKDDKEYYNLKFNFESYNNETLYILGHSNNYAILESCKINENFLVCEISKEILESILIKNNEKFKVGAIIDEYGRYEFDNILDIIIDYPITKKEDIYINITKLIDNFTAIRVPLGFETNIINLPNLITENFTFKDNLACYFKKINGKPLMFFLIWNTYYSKYTFGQIKEEIILDKIHYKYNFRIQPFENNEIIKVTGSGNLISLIYPQELNFLSKKYSILRYIMPDSYSFGSISLNQGLTDLICDNRRGMKFCNVSISEFKRNISGYFYTYRYSSYSYQKYYDSIPIKVLLPYEEIIDVYLLHSDNLNTIYIGKNGILYFVTNLTDDETNIFSESDIETKSEFNTTIINYQGYSQYNYGSYEVNCRLWKPKKEKLLIICQFKGNLRYPEGYSKFRESSSIFDKYLINIMSDAVLKIKQFKIESLPFLYSDSQIINIDEEKNLFNVKFKIGIYNNDPIFLKIKQKEKEKEDFSYIILDGCNIEEQYLNCQITKDRLEEILINNTQILSLYYQNMYISTKVFETVFDIIINYNNIQKENVYVHINNLLVKNVEYMGSFAYDTNITTISNLTSDFFLLEFNGKNNFNCFFKKTSEKKLLLVCMNYGEHGTYSLGQIKNEIKLDNINIKYNFLIQPVTNNDEFICDNTTNGSYVIFSKPSLLNFSLVEYSNIEIILRGQINNIEIKLNPDSDANLNCEKSFYNSESTFLNCTIPLSHFKEKKSGYYYIYYKDNSGNYQAFYEISPIQIILPNENDIYLRIKKEYQNNLKVATNGYLLLITNYKNDEKSIFRNKDLENDTKFNSTIVDNLNNEYKVYCKLWNPIDEYIRLICKFNVNLISYRQNLFLNLNIFDYNGHKIIIIQDEFLEVNRISNSIPFLYSDKQTININDKINSYHIKFKMESYNNDLLCIYSSTYNTNIQNNYEIFAIFDNCFKNENENILDCEISKEKIEEILTINNRKFKIGALIDYSGLINMDNIMDITINYENVIKEDIYIGLTKLIGGITEKGVPLGYETNITKIPNLNSELFNNCYFKKTNGKPLLFLFIYPLEFDSPSLYYSNDEKILNNIHYKYNFRIQPYLTNDSISIKGEGTDIKLINPEELNYQKQNSILVRFIARNPSLIKNFKINPNSNILQCYNYDSIKFCNIPNTHFIGKKSGNFNIYHTNHLGQSVINYESSLIKVILPEEDIFEIYVNDQYNYQEIKVGFDGIIYFVTNYTDNKNIFDATDIEEKTSFSTTITDETYYNYNVICRLWKPKNEKIRILCKINGQINNNYRMRINSAFFYYNNRKMAIVSNMSFATRVVQIFSFIPFLYSEKQTINVNKEKDSYDLSLKFDSYNNEVIYIAMTGQELNHIILDDCENKGKELTCKIKKDNIEEILGNSGDIFKCEFYDNSLGNPLQFPLVFDIQINYNDIKKEDVYIKINKLLESNIYINNYIAYETNITSLNNVVSNQFLNIFDKNKEIPCLMKKSTEKPLLMICKINNEEQLSLGEIKQEIKLDNINIKYNFLIQPVINNEEFISKGNGNSLLFAYPMVLNYYFGDTLNINFYSKNILNDQKNIQILLESKALDCSSSNYVIKCKAPKNYFEESRYYYTYTIKNNENSSMFYELSPIQVILPNKQELLIKIKNENNIILIGQKGGMILETDYNGDLFDENDLEQMKQFEVNFTGYDKNYIGECYLWKPKNRNIRMICKFKENLNTYYIKLNKYSLNYKNQVIAFISEKINIKQSDSSIALLYNNPQIITNTNDEFIISFKKVVYNKEPLILYKEGLKNIILDCKEETLEITCKIKKDTLFEILTNNEEKYYLSQITDSEAIQKFDNVFDISFNVTDIQKQNIYINITKLIANRVEDNTFIVYETNITDIPQITTDYFNLVPDRNAEILCMFKKREEENLLLLCKAQSSGSLGKINKIEINDINIFYNFIIEETQIDDKYTVVVTKGTKISLVYPTKLDFTVKDKYMIYYQTEYPERLTAIRLNKSSKNELICSNKNGLRECIVTKDHFTKSGLYNTYHNCIQEYYLVSYEIPKIKVIWKENDKNEEEDESYAGVIAGCVIGGLILIGIIAFFIIRHYRRKKAGENVTFTKMESLAQVELS